MNDKDNKRRQTMMTIDKAVLVGLLITLLVILLMMVNEMIKT